MRVAAVLLITFLLVGLWHGAHYNFLLLGLWHGSWMVIYTFGVPLVPRRLRSIPGGRYFAAFLHLIVVLLPGAVMFREVSLSRVWQHFAQNPFANTQEEMITATIVFGMLFVVASPLWLAMVLEKHVLPKIRHKQWFLPLQTTVWGVEAAAIFLFYRGSASDFIYFQF